MSQSSISRLLKIINPYLGENALVTDARSLLKTLRKTPFKSVSPGSYYHFGLKIGVINFLKRHKLFSSTQNVISIMVNIDRLPIANSSSNQLWPILCSVTNVNHVFMVGLYHSNYKKPNSFNEFFKDFCR